MSLIHHFIIYYLHTVNIFKKIILHQHLSILYCIWKVIYWLGRSPQRPLKGLYIKFCFLSRQMESCMHWAKNPTLFWFWHVIFWLVHYSITSGARVKVTELLNRIAIVSQVICFCSGDNESESNIPN